MANPLLQKARQQKMIYFGAIVALFTLSLVHREFVVKEQALRLQLRETARGEVELTSSAVRLMLTGSRGVAVTMLWYNAMEKQRRNEWHELELLVRSVTKLQPYFITPWLFQSWNIAFNVAVECDRPRDKYYYISRGLELLAEGERRNRGVGDEGAAPDPDRIVFPGNPELRHYMGFFYQLKIGNSDERLTMRSLLEMSCIDPLERNPDKFWEDRVQQKVDMTRLGEFCQNHPRLVRRLNEQLGYSDPQRIVQFLQDHQNIPSRFRPSDRSNQVESVLKMPPQDQFPILPPHEGDWPDPSTYAMTNESVDVFLFSRTWYEFAQKPMPPPDPNPKSHQPEYDRLRYRMPKQMVAQLFRAYPSRAQSFRAEALDSEGFFDKNGWDINPWFESYTNRRYDPVGTDAKYHSRLAWRRSYEMTKEYGVRNGMYIPAAERFELEKEAQSVVKAANAKLEDRIAFRPEWGQGPLAESWNAYNRIEMSRYFTHLTNYEAFMYQAEGESDPAAIVMRSELFQAERTRKEGKYSNELYRQYDEAFDLYLFVCFKYPRFAQVVTLQEDTYELQLKLLRYKQDFHSALFRKAAVQAARLTPWPSASVPGLAEALSREFLVAKFEKNDQSMLRVVPFRLRYGVLDRAQYYNGAGAKDLKEAFLFRWIQGANVATNMSLASTVTFPGQEYYLLTRLTDFAEDTAPPGWHLVVKEEHREVARGRLGIKR